MRKAKPAPPGTNTSKAVRSTLNTPFGGKRGMKRPAAKRLGRVGGGR